MDISACYQHMLDFTCSLSRPHLSSVCSLWPSKLLTSGSRSGLLGRRRTRCFLLFARPPAKPRTPSPGEKVGIAVHKGSLANQGLADTLRDALNEHNLQWLPTTPSVEFKKVKSRSRPKSKIHRLRVSILISFVRHLFARCTGRVSSCIDPFSCCSPPPPHCCPV